MQTQVWLVFDKYEIAHPMYNPSHLMTKKIFMKSKLCRQLASMSIIFSTVWTNSVLADDGMAGMHHMAPGNVIKAKIDSTTNSFESLMGTSMEAMNTGMAKAPMTGNPDHDFAAMMVPHHQGAVDMAKAELLYGKNPILRRLAQEIIVTQDSEIQIMQSELKKAPRKAP